MSLEGVLAAGRRAAESRMTSRALVRRTDGVTPGPDGFEVSGFADVYVGIKFRLPGAHGTTSSRTVKIGETELQLATRYADFPWDTELRDDDVFEVTAGERPGRFFRVVESTGADQQTKLRVPVIETERPAGWV